MPQALTHQTIAREAAAMLVEGNFVGAQINTDPDEDFGQQINGYKIGDTVKIKVPPVPVVFDGATFAGGGNAPQLQEQSVSLQVNKQKHVPISFGAKEKKLELSDFKERFLRPAMNSLTAFINADLLNDMKNFSPNVVPITIATPRQAFRSASSVLDRFLAPVDQRRMHINSDTNDAFGEQNAALFNPSTEITEEFQKNRIGQFASWDFFVNQSMPVHVVGAGAGYVMSGAGVDGATQIAVTTGTGAIAKGSVLTIGPVQSVHPLTGVTNGKSRQYVVTADYAGGAGNIQIYPPLSLTVLPPTANPKIGNINVLPANTNPITLQANGAGKATCIGFHRNAVAAAFPPLGVLASCEGYTATLKNISVRVMTFGDGKADQEHTRIDVLYGDVGVRPDHIVRLNEAT